MNLKFSLGNFKPKPPRVGKIYYISQTIRPAKNPIFAPARVQKIHRELSNSRHWAE